MTLIVAVNGPETIWLMADRRLSFRARPPRDDARKIMFLETADGVAIVGYAGLGATAAGTEPADWMSSVLRGRALSLENSLGVLADAMKRQFPRHMLRMPGCPSHHVLATAFVGEEVRLFTIDMAYAPDRRSYQFRYTRHVVERPALKVPLTPPLGIAGSGALYLMRDQKWMRKLLRVVKANERGRVSTSAVASHLAYLNSQVHTGVSDGSVGPGCIVAWRHRKNGVHKGGGGHEFFIGTERDPSSPALPTISNGLDVSALVGLMMPRFMSMAEAWQAGQPREEWDKDEVNAELAHLPDTPDENLR